MARGDDEDRPRKSWREIDAGRDKSGHRKDDRPAAGRKARPTSQAYRSYKTQLDKIFSGGGLPDALKEKLAESGVGVEAKQRKEAAQAILDAKTPSKIRAALDAYREAHGFPVDEPTLTKLLELDDEPEIVVEAIGGLTALQEEGTLKRASALKGRLKTVQMTIDDDDVFAAAKRLLGML